MVSDNRATAILSDAMGASENPELERGLGLKEAVALNMIEIVGIGPFVVSGIVIRDMGGPQALLAWLGGAVLATLDAFVWSELGAAMPKAGGSYVFLREDYGPLRWGRLMAFLFVWQTFVQAPLSIASASIGFTRYAGYLHPLSKWEAKAVSGGLVILLVILLYRRITTIGKISLLLWAGVIATLLWLIWGGMTHFNAKMAFDFPSNAFSFSPLWFAGLGSAMVSTIYSYWGYYNICNLGGEIREPEKNIPRGIFLSVLGITVLYMAMQTSILGVIPWREAQNSKFIVSTFVDRAGFGVLRFTGIFAGTVFGGARWEFFPDFWTIASDKKVSAHFIAGAGHAGIFLQHQTRSGNFHRGNLGDAADRTVHRSSRRRDAVARKSGNGIASLQNVSVPIAGGIDDDRLGLALLAYRRGAQMGIAGDRAGRVGVSGLDSNDETMAVREESNYKRSRRVDSSRAVMMVSEDWDQ